MITEKTPYPDWANPYQAEWTGADWIVRFPGFSEAHDGRTAISKGRTEDFVVYSDPNSNDWYVYEVTDAREKP